MFQAQQLGRTVSRAHLQTVVRAVDRTLEDTSTVLLAESPADFDQLIVRNVTAARQGAT
jgi:hypothetical protein